MRTPTLTSFHSQFLSHGISSTLLFDNSFLPAFLILFVSAAILCAGLVALLVRILPRNFLAAAMNARSNHEVEARQLGGLALIPTITLLMALAGPLFDFNLRTLVFALTGAQILWLTGFLDDRASLPVAVRFGAQLLAASLCIYGLPDEVRLLPTLLPSSVESVLLVLGLAYFINIVNFMDGLDLMVVSGLGIPMSALGLFACVGLIVPGYGAMAMIIAGGLLGFALFNKPKARVFLGDSGSLPLGLLCGTVFILVAPELGLVPVLILPLYFLADSTTTLIRRLRAGENILAAHSQHAYQQAKRSGWPVWRVVGAVAALNTVLGLSAWLATSPDIAIIFLGALLAVTATAAMLYLFRKRQIS